MANRSATELIEMPTNVTIWTCDTCGREERTDRYDAISNRPVGWWVGYQIGTEYAVQSQTYGEFCSAECLASWAMKEASSLAP